MIKNHFFFCLNKIRTKFNICANKNGKYLLWHRKSNKFCPNNETRASEITDRRPNITIIMQNIRLLVSV